MIKPYFRSFEEEAKDLLVGIERGKELNKYIDNYFPNDVDVQLSISISLGKGTIRAFIYLDKNSNEEETHKAVKFLNKFSDNNKSERSFRDETGKFMWSGKRKHENEDTFEEMIMIENAHAQNCVINKVTKTVDVFEAVCDGKVVMS